MKKLVICIASAMLSTTVLANNPVILHLFNVGAATMSVDYKICDTSSSVCGPVTTVDIQSAQDLPGKNVADITIPGANPTMAVSVIQAIEKKNGVIIAKTVFSQNSGVTVTGCSGQGGGEQISLDDMKGTPYITCANVSM